MAHAAKIKVLIVDDSAVVRKALTTALSQDSDIEVVGTAIDPYFARDKILRLKPDVLTLDLEMPRMDGLTFLKILMDNHPMPVIVMSSLTKAGSNVAMEALRYGAVDVVEKPSPFFSVEEIGPQLIEKVKGAISAKISTNEKEKVRCRKNDQTVLTDFRSEVVYKPRQIVLLGASTGGTEALEAVITQFPAHMPGICVVQHIPPYFSKAFADRMNHLSALRVKEAQHGDLVEPGLVLIAPGNYHLLLDWVGSGYRVETRTGPMVWHQRPAVDVLFKSALNCGAAPYAVAAVLTGMGQDGAEGLLALRQEGAQTFAQSKETCVVYGMPKACKDLEAAERMVGLPLMAPVIQHAVRQMATSLTACGCSGFQ